MGRPDGDDTVLKCHCLPGCQTRRGQGRAALPYFPDAPSPLSGRITDAAQLPVDAEPIRPERLKLTRFKLAACRGLPGGRAQRSRNREACGPRPVPRWRQLAPQAAGQDQGPRLRGGRRPSRPIPQAACAVHSALSAATDL